MTCGPNNPVSSKVKSFWTSALGHPPTLTALRADDVSALTRIGSLRFSGAPPSKMIRPATFASLVGGHDDPAYVGVVDADGQISQLSLALVFGVEERTDFDPDRILARYHRPGDELSAAGRFNAAR